MMTKLVDGLGRFAAIELRSMSTHRSTDPRRVVVTGMGLITSIGNNRAQVLDSLREGKTGIEYYPELEREKIVALCRMLNEAE